MSNSGRIKRPFAGAAADPSQRQITSFFTSAADTPSSSAVDGTTSTARRHHVPLPPSVQSDLLSVGMRIRKSVPEGYKTRSAVPAFKLYPRTDTSSPNTAAAAAAAAAANSRELLPFCGIHNVGGLAPQPSSTPVVHVRDDLVGEDGEVEGLAWSQETVDSTMARKRAFADDDDDDEIDAQQQEELHGELSSGSRGNARLLAVPHSRIIKGGFFRNEGQENMHVDGDFEEADFLVFDEEQDLDMLV